MSSTTCQDCSRRPPATYCSAVCEWRATGSVTQPHGDELSEIYQEAAVAISYYTEDSDPEDKPTREEYLRFMLVVRGYETHLNALCGVSHKLSVNGWHAMLDHPAISA